MDSDATWPTPPAAQHLLDHLAQCRREIEFLTDEMHDACIEVRFFRGYGPGRPRTTPLTSKELSIPGTVKGDWPLDELTRMLRLLCRDDSTPAQIWDLFGEDWRENELDHLRDEKFRLVARMDDLQIEYRDLIRSASAAGAPESDVAQTAGVPVATVSAIRSNESTTRR